MKEYYFTINREQLITYCESVYNSIINKLIKGEKRIVVGFPTGCGKSKMILRIYNDFFNDRQDQVLFIFSHKSISEQFNSLLSKNSKPKCAITAQELFHSTEILSKKSILFLDCLEPPYKRELSRIVGDNHTIISFAHIPLTIREITS